MRIKPILLVLFFTATILQAFIIESVPVPLTVSTDVVNLVAGAVNEVEITVENNGRLPVAQVQVKLVPATPSVTVIGFSSILIEKIGAGSSYSFKVKLLVPRTIYGSAVSLTIYLYYRDPLTGIQFTDTSTLSFLVKSRCYLEPVFVERKGNKVSIVLRNPSPIKLSNASVHLEYGGVIVSSPYFIKIEAVDSEGNVTLDFKLIGFYDYITIAVTYDDGWTDRYTVKLPGSAHNIVVESVERMGGNVTVKLTNMGEDDEEDIKVSLKYMGAVAGLPYETTIPLIKAGETKLVSFQLPQTYTQITVSIVYPDEFKTEKTFSIGAFSGTLLELRCTYPERRGELGTTVYYPISIVNRGLSDVYKLSVTGLPSLFKWRFLKDNSEIQAVYLEEGQQNVVLLAVDIPKIPLNFTLDKTISFKVTVKPESGGAAGELELKLTPTTTSSLQVYSKGWYGEAISGVQGLHYVGIPYSTGLLPKGSTVSAKYRLEENKTYVILLYGPFVGTRSDLNLYLLDVNGGLLAVSANGQGEPETLTVRIGKTGLYLLVVSNEETTSRSMGEGVLLVSELQPAPGTTTIHLQPPLFQASIIVNLTGLTGTVHLTVKGGDFTALLYPFSTNREKTRYDPFVPRASTTVKSVNGSAELEYTVKRGDALILVQFKASRPLNLTIECRIQGEKGVEIGLLEQDLIYLAAILATITLIAVALWGEKTIGSKKT